MIDAIPAAISLFRAAAAVGVVDFAARDPREPGRRAKQESEDKVAGSILGHWRKQATGIRDYLSGAAGVGFLGLALLSDFRFWTAEQDALRASLMPSFTDAVMGGVKLFADDALIGMSDDVINVFAAQFAREHSFELVKGITDTTRSVLQQQVNNFITTPGYTLRDVMNALPFDEERALTVATTEITRAYAEGQEMAGKQLQSEFPGVKVVKIWQTNNDDRVCPLCGPLNGKETGLDEPYDEAGTTKPPRHVRCRCWQTVTTNIEESA